MVVLELETIYAQVAPHTKLLNKRFVGAHNWLGPLKEAFVARLAADKVNQSSSQLYNCVNCCMGNFFCFFFCFIYALLTRVGTV